MVAGLRANLISLSVMDPVPGLIVIDAQKGDASRRYIHSPRRIWEKVRRLTSAFDQIGLPTVFVRTVGDPAGRTERGQSPGLQEALPYRLNLDLSSKVHIVTKKTWSAFASTELDAYLRSQRVSQTILAGIGTGTSIESSGRQAYDLGFNVTFAIDAMTDTSYGRHCGCTAVTFPLLGEIAKTAEIVRLLAKNRQI